MRRQNPIVASACRPNWRWRREPAGMWAASWRRTFGRSPPRGLGAPLHTQAGSECSTALALVDPDEPDERSTGWDLRAVDGCPITVRGMISDLGAFSRTPADAVFS
eukprot:172443-Pleurochrysis_carterae.AAC.4